MTQVPKLRMGKGIKFSHGVYNSKRNWADWAPVKLGFKVVEQAGERFIINRRKKGKL